MNYLDINLKNLRKINEVFAQELMSIKPQGSIQDTVSGSPTCFYFNDDKTIYLYSRRDPKAECQRFLGKFDLTKYEYIILFGFGLGYIPELIINTFPHIKKILIYEAAKACFVEALMARDLTAIFTSGKIVIYLEEPVAKLSHFFKEHAYLGYSSHLFITKPEVFNRNADYYTLLKVELLKRIKAFVTSFNIKFDSRRIIEYQNLFANIRYHKKISGIGSFKNLFLGKPALCISAGPSLKKEITVIKEHQEKVVIIACDTALKLLFDNDITPDFITTADQFDRNYNNFKDIFSKCHKIPLIADLGSNKNIIKDYPGPIFFYGNKTVISQWLSSFIPNLDNLSRGFSVALTSYHLALYLGCEPVILAGQDLCYHLNDVGTVGIKKEGAIYFKDNAAYMDRGDAQRGYYTIPLKPVLDLAGEQAYVSEEFVDVKNEFEQVIKVLEKETINTTSSGLAIMGTKEKPLDFTLRNLKINMSSQKTDLKKLLFNFEVVDKAKRRQELAGILKTAQILSLKLNPALSVLEVTPNNFYTKAQLEVLKAAHSEIIQYQVFLAIIQELFPAKVFTLNKQPAFQIIRKTFPDELKPEHIIVLRLLFSILQEAVNFLQEQLDK